MEDSSSYSIKNAVGLIRDTIVNYNGNVFVVTHKFVDTDALMSVYLLLSSNKYLDGSKDIRQFFIKFIDQQDNYDNKIAEYSTSKNKYITVDLDNGLSNCIGHNHLDDRWSSCKIILEAMKTMPEFNTKKEFNSDYSKLEFLVDYSTRAEQRRLLKEERSKNSLVNFIYGLRSQQDVISDATLFNVFKLILDSIISPTSLSNRLTVEAVVTDIQSVLDTIPYFSSDDTILKAIETMSLRLDQLINKYVEFRTLDNGIKVAINRSYHNLIRPLFARFGLDIVLFENKYRRIGLILNANSSINIENLYEFLKDKDSRWKFIKEINLISKKVSIEESTGTEIRDNPIEEILEFINNVFTKEEKSFKRHRVSHFD